MTDLSRLPLQGFSTVWNSIPDTARADSRFGGVEADAQQTAVVIAGAD